MAHFYGTIQGNRGEKSRAGSKNSGITATVASWEGAVDVRLYHDEATDRDMAVVLLKPWRGQGVSRELYRGPVNGE